MSKKGISPLVATVLLVAFSVALGALVMSWGQEYIEEKAEFVQGMQEVKSGCDVANLNIIKIGGIPQVCLKGDNKIQVWFDNGPDMDIYNIHARVAGTDGVSVQEEILKAPLLRENAVKAAGMGFNLRGALVPISKNSKMIQFINRSFSTDLYKLVNK